MNKKKIKKDINLRVKEKESLIKPSFHDGELCGVQLGDNKTIEIFLKTTTNKPYKVILKEVMYFKMNNFREGNIILDVCIKMGIEPDEDELNELLDLSPYDPKSQDYMQKVVQSIKDGSAALFQLNASYGAEVQGLCKKVEIVQN